MDLNTAVALAKCWVESYPIRGEDRTNDQKVIMTLLTESEKSGKYHTRAVMAEKELSRLKEGIVSARDILEELI